MAGPPGTLFLLLSLLPLLCLRGRGQGFGQTRFICTSVPLDGDMCAATAPGTGSAEELKSTVLQLRETVLQQKETIMNQKETIRELTAKLGRCESQSVLEGLPGEPKGGGAGRKGGFSKNTMGDLSRTPAAETLSQLGQTLQSLKTRLENLEVRAASRPRGRALPPRREPLPGAERGALVTARSCARPLQQFSRMNSSSQTNNLKDILQNKIDDLEKQVLSRVNSLEEGKFNPKNESEERGKIESTLTSLHQRISDLEKGTGRSPAPRDTPSAAVPVPPAACARSPGIERCRGDAEPIRPGGRGRLCRARPISQPWSSPSLPALAAGARGRSRGCSGRCCAPGIRELCGAGGICSSLLSQGPLHNGGGGETENPQSSREGVQLDPTAPPSRRPEGQPAPGQVPAHLPAAHQLHVRQGEEEPARDVRLQHLHVDQVQRLPRHGHPLFLCRARAG